MAEPWVGSQQEYGEDAVTGQLRIRLSCAVRSGLPGLWGRENIVEGLNQSLTFKEAERMAVHCSG